MKGIFVLKLRLDRGIEVKGKTRAYVLAINSEVAALVEDSY